MLLGLILCLISLEPLAAHAHFSSGIAQTSAAAADQSAPSSEQEAQQRALALAEAAASVGDSAGARALLEEAFGEEVLQVDDARPPRIIQSLLLVRSGPEGREIALQLVDGHDPGSARELILESAQALERVAPVVASGNTLTVTLAYTDPAMLVSAQNRVAAALPRLPELALLSSALSTRRLAWPEEAGLLTRTSRYEERVDLRPSVRTWNGEAGKLEAAAGEAAQSAETLDQVRSTVWRADARAWRDMSALSRATYQVKLQEQGAGPEWLQARVHQFYQEGSVSREWMIRAGEARQLEAAILGWRYDRLAMTAGAAVLLAALAIAFMWFVSR